MRKYLIEFVGTFFLVLVIALTGNPLAIGSMLMCMVFMGGPISGAHYNPAVSLAMIIRGKINGVEALKYMLFQLLGAIAASLIFYFISGRSFVPAPASSAVGFLPAFLIEFLFTFALATVVLNVATTRSSVGNSYYGIAIGFLVMAAAFAGGPISGGAFNPAVGIGPILADAAIGGPVEINNILLYITGPFLGGIAAGYFFRFINSDELKD